MGCKADLAANSTAIGKKFNAADRPSPDYHGPRGVMQRVPRLIRMLLSCAFAITFSAQASAQAIAQDFPAKPIHIVIPDAPGGGSDILARPLALDLSDRLKNPLWV